MIFVTLFLIATLLLFASYTDRKRLQEQNIPIPIRVDELVLSGVEA